MVTMIVYSHHFQTEKSYDSVREAIDDGLGILEFGQGFPYKIIENGEVLWDAKENDLFDFSEKYGNP